MRIRRDFKRIEGVRSARLVIIAAEGMATENIYFEAMKTQLCASEVHVKVLHRDTNGSSPENVLAQIRHFMDEYTIEDDDQLWIVVDKDKWQDKMLSSVAQYCSQNDNLNLALSNPCFELWLILHLEDVASYTEDMKLGLALNTKVKPGGDTWSKHRMKELTGHYREANYDAYALLHHVHDAIKRAEALDINPADRWPQQLGTRVYLLARSIMGK